VVASQARGIVLLGYLECQEEKGPFLGSSIRPSLVLIRPWGRRTGRGGLWWAAAPQTRSKRLFFGQKLNFSEAIAAKNEKYFFLYLLNEKNGIHSV